MVSTLTSGMTTNPLQCQISSCVSLGQSHITLNTLRAAEIFITGILTDFTNLKMQRVLGKHANRGTKSIKTVNLAPVKGEKRERGAVADTAVSFSFFILCLCLSLPILLKNRAGFFFFFLPPIIR